MQESREGERKNWGTGGSIQDHLGKKQRGVEKKQRGVEESRAREGESRTMDGNVDEWERDNQEGQKRVRSEKRSVNGRR